MKIITSKMSTRSILVAVFTALFFQGCISDGTTNADFSRISEIIIESGMDSTYNMNLGEDLVIAPKITQKDPSKTVQYQWEVDNKVVSTSSTLSYHGLALGTYYCRLVLSNVDGKTFFPFVINVNSEYEEGLTILSQDTQGNSYINFMLTPTDGSTPKFYDEEIFSYVNPTEHFAAGAVDILQTRRIGVPTGSLVVTCQGNASDKPTFYYLEEKTFVLENTIEVGDFTGFKPLRVMMPFINTSGATYPILCEDGKTYEFGAEGAVARPTMLQYTYGKTAEMVSSKSGYDYASLYWDTSINALCELYNGYGPYYCSSYKSNDSEPEGYHAKRDSIVAHPEWNYFASNKYVNMVISPEKPDGKGEPDIIVFSKSQLGSTPIWNLNRSIINYAFWVYNYTDAINQFSQYDKLRSCAVGQESQLPITETTPLAAGKKYESLYYATGNTIKRWYYTNSYLLNSAIPFGGQIGTANCIITQLYLMADQERLYVSFYDPTQTTGKNGSVWLINADSGEVLAKYDNICYKPIKMIYKDK